MIEKTTKSGPCKVKVVDKPWGSEYIYAHTDQYVGKILNIKGGHQLSYQYHNNKEETIYIISGVVEVVTEGETHELHTGASFHIKPGFKHRFRAIYDSVISEVSTPFLEDIVRIQDDYDRK